MMSGIIVTPRVLRWLRNGRPARILHVFDDACNLVNDQNEIVSLVSPRVGPGPFTIVIEGDFPVRPDVEQPVLIDPAGQTLTVGSLVVDTGQAAAWQPKPDWSKLHDADVDSRFPPVELSPTIQSSLQQMMTGIITSDCPRCLAGVRGLAGRGLGLTPTGDDVLIGALYGLWVRHPQRFWMDAIVAAAVPLTTTLSANFLRAAAAGEATWPWHDLTNGCPQAVANIVSIGLTSGADAWAGFVYASSALKAAMKNAHRQG